MAYTDVFSGQHGGLNAPYRNAVAITPHDTNELAVLPRALMARTTAGIVDVMMADDTVSTIIYLPLGVPVPVRARIVKITGIVAAGIVALW